MVEISEMSNLSCSREMLEKFWAKNPHQADISALERFLNDIPDYETPSNVLPIDELEERLLLIEKLEKYWEQIYSILTNSPKNTYRPFGPMQVASLMVLDMKTLRDVVGAEGPMVYIARSGILKTILRMPAISKMRKCRLHPSH